MNKEAEQLLVSLGQSLTGYEYLRSKPVFERVLGTETVTIGGKVVPLNKRLFNYQTIENYLYGNGDKGLIKCFNQLQANKKNYNAMINIACGYLGDILKFSNEMIPDSIELIEALIIRTTNNINANSASLFKQYDREIEQGERYIQTTLSERQAKTLYDAENNKLISATIYPEGGMFGTTRGTISYASGSLVDVDSEMSAHNYAANEMRDTNQRVAKSTLDEKLYNMISDELATFVSQFENILITKREDLFDKINYQSNDISVFPYKYSSYIENEKFNQEDFPNVKKVMEYYGILEDFVYDLENDIYSKIKQSMEDGKEVRNSKNQELYLYLTGKENINNIIEHIFNYLYTELKVTFDDHEAEIDEYDIERAEEIVAIVKKYNNFFDNSKAEKASKLLDDIKLRSQKEVEENKRKEAEERKNDPVRKAKRKKRIIWLFVFIAVVIFWVVQYNIIKDPVMLGQQLGQFLGILLVIGLVRGIAKLVEKFRGY